MEEKKLMQAMRMRLEEQEKLIQALKEGQPDREASLLYNKRKVMEIFDAGSDFALRFFRMAMQNGYAIQVGREYFITKENFDRFLTDNTGQQVAI